ncbi:MAG TPA: ABC transporter permease [Gemmataceae bacterium]|nr:ABC transporter permease [Gemmataceae bacterium]
MSWVALKMLTGNRAKYYAIIFGISFAVMLMSQQTAIFTGLMRNTTSQIRDIAGADMWIMDPSVQFIDDITPLSNNAVYQVRGVPGVAWAVPFYDGKARAQFPDGHFKQFIVLGLDDQTLVGAPRKMLAGALTDLRRPDAVIIDESGYRYLFPGQPLRTGLVFEMNDRRAVIVGVCEASPTFQTFPVAYTTYSRATRYAAQERRALSFVLAKAEADVPVEEACRRIEEQTGLVAMSPNDFAWKTIVYYMKMTGIPVNFGITVLLGFVIGAAIAGQTFYLFTLDNLKQFGALKAMGVDNRRIAGMVLMQGLVVGALGYMIGLGIGTAFMLVMGMAMRSRGLPPANFMAWPIPLGTALAAALIVAVSALISLRRVLRLEPASVFR